MVAIEAALAEAAAASVEATEQPPQVAMECIH